MSPPPPTTREELAEAAAELGVVVGVSSAPPGPEAARLREFLDGGRHGEMHWLARDPDRRADPGLVLPGARAVVSVGESCWGGPLPQPPRDRPRARIARYALGRDYHRTLLGKVRRLARLMGPTARPYVDTGPVLEKARAQRSGLGWIGKHTNAVSRAFGSWWMLGAVLVEAELPADAPHVDRCGTCTRCLEACPTGALDPATPYRMDARRCISYLTIELRGPIPRDLRPAVGTWVFGCDLCLDVCPWNRFAQLGDARYRPRPEWQHPPLERLLDLSEAEFDELTRGSPIRRARRRGLARNAAVALGNAGDRAAVPALARALQRDPDALVRGHAAWALGQLGGAAARAALGGARDEDPWVREEIALALEAA